MGHDLSPSPFRLQQMLTVRGHAYAMSGAGHLGSWSLYVAHFMEFYAAPAGEHFRAPNLSEAEEADQQATREIFSLCISGATQLLLTTQSPASWLTEIC